GKYTLVVYAHRRGTASFDVTRSVDVDVQPAAGQVMALDIPSTTGQVSSSFVVAGWALDLNATNGPGVDVVNVWAVPQDGEPALFLGTADYGFDRPDVAAVYGVAAKSSAYSLKVADLPPGTYRIVVTAHSCISGGFDQVRSRIVTVAGPPR